MERRIRVVTIALVGLVFVGCATTGRDPLIQSGVDLLTQADRAYGAGRYDEAEASAEQFLATLHGPSGSPGNAPPMLVEMAWFMLLSAQIAKERLDLAEQSLGKCGANPYCSIGWLPLGRAQVKKGRDDLARQAFDRCLELSGGAECAHELGRIERRQGNIEQAIVRYQQALARTAQDLQNAKTPEARTAYLNQLVPMQLDLELALPEQKRRAQAQQEAREERPAASASGSLELAFWDSVKNSTRSDELQAYLQKFPRGTFAELARARLAALGEAPVRLNPIAAPAPGTVNFGGYHALVIGIDNYRAVTPLKTAVHDAKTVADLLSKEYGFKVTLLIDATRDRMLDAFDELRRTLTETDNLLVYYAGHGFLDRDSDRGFWLPVDAHADRRANWLSNSDIADMVRGTRAKHVLVVADSCYAGTLTRNIGVQMSALDDFARLSQKRARTALVSGGLEPVEDAGGGSHSVFAKAFIDQLLSNTGVVDMSQIFSAMRRQVILSAAQTPQYGDIRQTGHEGGDFIFVRRRSGN